MTKARAKTKKATPRQPRAVAFARKTSKMPKRPVALPPVQDVPLFAFGEDGEPTAESIAWVMMMARTGAGTDATIAGALDISESWLKEKFGRHLHKARCLRKLDIGRWQTVTAMGGNPAMLIWLGKQTDDKFGLGQSEPVQVSANIDWSQYTDEELELAKQGKLKPRA